jgi:hypothetical protein
VSDIDPEVVRLTRDLLIQTDKLGAGHQTRAQNIAHRLDLAGKVILDKGSVPEWMEPCADVGTGPTTHSTLSRLTPSRLIAVRPIHEQAQALLARSTPVLRRHRGGLHA